MEILAKSAFFTIFVTPVTLGSLFSVRTDLSQTLFNAGSAAASETSCSRLTTLR
jgi:hypothetical protein